MRSRLPAPTGSNVLIFSRIAVDFLRPGLAQAGDLLDGGAQIAVLVDVPDDELGDLPLGLVEERQGGLPVQMVPEGRAPGQRVFEGNGFPFFGEIGTEPVVQIVLEAGFDVQAVGILTRGLGFGVLAAGFGLLGGLGLLIGLGPGGRFLRPLLEIFLLELDHRVLGKLLVDDLDELQVRQRQELDGLLEGRGEDELLDLPLVQPLFEHCRSSFRRAVPGVSTGGNPRLDSFSGRPPKKRSPGASPP